MEDNKKSLIIAERIKLGFASELTAFIIFAAIMIALLIVAIYFEIIMLIVFCAVLLVAIIILGTVDMVYIYRNNHLPPVILTYKNNVFTLCDEVKPLKIAKEEIVDMTYKNKKSFIYTPYFFSSQEWNYGTLILYLKDKESPELCQKLTIKNVADPDKVFEKISHILGWDMEEE